MFGEYRRWKWYEGDSHHEQQVAEDQGAISAPNVLKKCVMVRPHDANDKKAQHLAHIIVASGAKEPTRARRPIEARACPALESLRSIM
jgi:hypothetical protein